jgi:hypothetical protein
MVLTVEAPVEEPQEGGEVTEENKVEDTAPVTREETEVIYCNKPLHCLLCL